MGHLPETIGKYLHTVKYLKPQQVFWRIAKKIGVNCRLGRPKKMELRTVRSMSGLWELDQDPVFLNRFSVEDLMQDKICFLYEEESFSWQQPWHFEKRSHLWNFNLHYFEYLHPLVKQFQETGEAQYLEKTVQMIRSWIQWNPREKAGDGWSAYTISLRLTNWLSYLSFVESELDESFRKELEVSIWEQYRFLSTHLEKDILGNHYFENLKTLVLCALHFGDEDALAVYLREFRKECREEILPDGMHFELSPMYQKIVLEGLLRVAVALAEVGMPDSELETMVQSMTSAAFSMEQNLSRTPLFNDAGDNVAKSLDALLACAQNRLQIQPSESRVLPDSGYYFFQNGPWKMIVDAGAPGPDYIPGHSHCDAMSFELYHNGEPVLVNCGTYGYQCKERSFFRSTQAHNSVQVAGTEQSEIWSAFRLARRSKTKVLGCTEKSIQMEMVDYQGNRIYRELLLAEDALYICDRSDGNELQSYLHNIDPLNISSNAEIAYSEALYAPEFGLLKTIHQITVTGRGDLNIRIPLTGSKGAQHYEAHADI